MNTFSDFIRNASVEEKTEVYTKVMEAASKKQNEMVRLTNTQESSTKYGPCECCGKNVSEVWVKTGPKPYFNHEGKKIMESVGSTFGHRECLEAV